MRRRASLQEVIADGRKAVIAHETIAGSMGAMTMEFDAASPAELAGLAPGDVLAFRLSVAETRSWIDHVSKLGAAFGLAFSSTGVPLDHNLRTVVVDAAGRVQKVFIGNEWSPEELTAEMRRAMTAQP